jgi:hypothetical protein
MGQAPLVLFAFQSFGKIHTQKKRSHDKVDQSQPGCILLANGSRHRALGAVHFNTPAAFWNLMIVSRKRIKTGFRVSLGLLILVFFIIGFQNQIPVQFSSEELRENCQGALVISVPVLLFVVLVLYYQLGEKRFPVLLTIGGVLLSIVLFLSAAVMSYLSPQWSDKETLYQGRFTDQLIIRQVDNWGYKSRNIKVTPLMPGLRYVTLADLDCLPDQKWINLKDKSPH